MKTKWRSMALVDRGQGASNPKPHRSDLPTDAASRDFHDDIVFPECICYFEWLENITAERLEGENRFNGERIDGDLA
jgi:hypothetical protein